MDEHTKDLVLGKLYNRFNKINDNKIDKDEFYLFIKHVFNKLGYYNQSKNFS